MFKKSIVLTAVLLCVATDSIRSETGDGSWISLFDGSSLNGWKASENPGTFKVADGQIVCEGPRSHLFYAGEGADFRNFEFKAEVKTRPGANSGIYFHTEYQEKGWPDKGFEVQVNNTHVGEGGYRELKKTGSLYGLRNQYKSIVKDDEWFEMAITVEGKRVQIRVNDTLLVDFVEPEPPLIVGNYSGRKLSSGTFALQGHDVHSKAFFRNIRVRRLPDAIPGEAAGKPVVSDAYRQILKMQADNLPLINTHVHLKGGLTMEEAQRQAMKSGVFNGIAVNCGVGFPITNSAGVFAYWKSMERQPAFVAMQAEGREWVQLLTQEAIARFDYVFTDSMTYTDDEGHRMRLWIPSEVVVNDKEKFMDTLVERIEKICAEEPIDIYVNPTYLPDVIAREYDALWTPERMRRVVRALAKNQIAMEISARFKIPNEAFIRMAKEAGVKFTFGTNNGDKDIGNIDYCLEMFRKCELGASHLYVPLMDKRTSYPPLKR